MKATKAVLFIPAALGALGLAPSRDSAIEKAESLLKHADEELASAQTLQATFTDTAAYTKHYSDLKQTGTVSLSKPGSLRVEIVRARRVDSSKPWVDTGNNTMRISDGQHQFNVFFHPSSTQVRESKQAPTPALAEAPILAGFFGTHASPWKAFEAAKDKGELKDVQVNGSEVSFTVGSVERRVEIGSNGLISTLQEHKTGSPDGRTWHLESVKLDTPLEASTFSYTPPADALPYGRLEKLDPLEQGSDAPSDSFLSADGSTVKLSDLRGKVVLLKFWATWCWPCNQSMPETEELAAKYKSQGLETVAIAIKDSHLGFENWVAKHKQYGHIRFAFEDPLKPEASQDYQVSATPTVYLIGRDGKVITETEGFTGKNASFEQVVQAALAR